jgi:hypothetical protein
MGYKYDDPALDDNFREWLCICGHTADDHHIVYWPLGISIEECERYGFNETSGMAPVHEDGTACPHAGIWYHRAEDGIYRAPDGTTEDDHECDENHTWTNHCQGFTKAAHTPTREELEDIFRPEEEQ